VHLNNIFGFNGKPFSSRKPDAAAIVHGKGMYSRINGMVSVFRASNGLYVSAHFQDIPKIDDEIYFMLADMEICRILSKGKIAYFAFFTDMLSFSEIVNTRASLTIRDSEIAYGSILK